jgi:hypothetical protein
MDCNAHNVLQLIEWLVIGIQYININYFNAIQAYLIQLDLYVQYISVLALTLGNWGHSPEKVFSVLAMPKFHCLVYIF